MGHTLAAELPPPNVPRTTGSTRKGGDEDDTSRALPARPLRANAAGIVDSRTAAAVLSDAEIAAEIAAEVGGQWLNDGDAAPAATVTHRELLLNRTSYRQAGAVAWLPFTTSVASTTLPHLAPGQVHLLWVAAVLPDGTFGEWAVAHATTTEAADRPERPPPPRFDAEHLLDCTTIVLRLPLPPLGCAAPDAYELQWRPPAEAAWATLAPRLLIGAGSPREAGEGLGTDSGRGRAAERAEVAEVVARDAPDGVTLSSHVTRSAGWQLRVSGLQPAAQYEFRLRARNPAGASEPSASSGPLVAGIAAEAMAASPLARATSSASFRLHWGADGSYLSACLSRVRWDVLAKSTREAAWHVVASAVRARQINVEPLRCAQGCRFKVRATSLELAIASLNRQPESEPSAAFATPLLPAPSPATVRVELALHADPRWSEIGFSSELAALLGLYSEQVVVVETRVAGSHAEGLHHLPASDGGASAADGDAPARLGAGEKLRDEAAGADYAEDADDGSSAAGLAPVGSEEEALLARTTRPDAQQGAADASARQMGDEQRVVVDLRPTASVGTRSGNSAQSGPLLSVMPPAVSIPTTAHALVRMMHSDASWREALSRAADASGGAPLVHLARIIRTYGVLLFPPPPPPHTAAAATEEGVVPHLLHWVEPPPPPPPPPPIDQVGMLLALVARVESAAQSAGQQEMPGWSVLAGAVALLVGFLALAWCLRAICKAVESLCGCVGGCCRASCGFCCSCDSDPEIVHAADDEHDHDDELTVASWASHRSRHSQHALHAPAGWKRAPAEAAVRPFPLAAAAIPPPAPPPLQSLPRGPMGMATPGPPAPNGPDMMAEWRAPASMFERGA